MLTKTKRVDATTGSIPRLIVLYTLPLIFSTMIQTLFNAVDIVVLGNMADSSAVASVGATSTIIHLIVNTFIGLSSGTKVIMAQQVGAQDREGARKTVDTSLVSALCIGFAVMALGLFLSPLFLQLTKCPQDCYDGALLYIRIYVCAAPAIMIYNFGSSVISSSGDTQRPMYYIIACGALNVVLNIILCLILPQKVAAVAIATAVSQYLGAFLILRRLCVMEGLGKVELFKMRWNPHSFGRIMRIGLPIAISNALFPLANLQIQSAINSYGVSAVAGNSAAVTIEGFAAAFTSSFGATTSTFMGQNLGADNRERVKGSFVNCLWICLACSITVSVFLYVTGQFWLGIILPDDPLGVHYAMIRLFYVTLFYFVSGANSVISHGIQSFGYSVFTAANSITCVMGFRVLWMTFIYPKHENFHWLMACFLVSWVLMLIFNIVGFSVIYNRYRRGLYHKM